MIRADANRSACVGTIILMPKFELPKFCESVQKYKATSAFIVPPIALGLYARLPSPIHSFVLPCHSLRETTRRRSDERSEIVSRKADDFDAGLSTRW